VARIVGIDLGTTKWVVAVVQGGNPVVIPTAAGGNLCPSIVAFGVRHRHRCVEAGVARSG